MSEARFHIRPAANANLAIILRNQEPGRNSVSLLPLVKGSVEAELIVKNGHLRFDKHPQGFLGYDGEVFAYVKGWMGAEFTDYDNTGYHWKLVVLHERAAGCNDVWGQVPEGFNLDWGFVQQRELRVLLVHPATRGALTMFQGGGMGMVSIQPQFNYLCSRGGGVLKQSAGDAAALLAQLGNATWIVSPSSRNFSKQNLMSAVNVLTGGLMGQIAGQ